MYSFVTFGYRALATRQRSQTLSLINLINIKTLNDKIIIKIIDLIKIRHRPSAAGARPTLFNENAASSQTISRQIKQTLEEKGIDTNVFCPHSTRHAATSAALRARASLDTIRRCAGWTGQSTVFVSFYNRPIMNDSTNLFSNLLL